MVERRSRPTVPGTPPWCLYKVPGTHRTATPLARRRGYSNLGPKYGRIPVYIYDGYTLVEILLLDINMLPAYTR